MENQKKSYDCHDEPRERSHFSTSESRDRGITPMLFRSRSVDPALSLLKLKLKPPAPAPTFNGSMYFPEGSDEKSP